MRGWGAVHVIAEVVVSQYVLLGLAAGVGATGSRTMVEPNIHQSGCPSNPSCSIATKIVSLGDVREVRNRLHRLLRRLCCRRSAREHKLGC